MIQDPADAAKQVRNRWLLAIGATLLLATTFWWQAYSRAALRQHEARMVAADFPALRLQQTSAQVDEFGRVSVNGLLTEPPLAVGSLRLIPQGTYTALLIANDGNPAHIKKVELVIGARDANRRWYPPTAEAVAKRLQAP
ncbi:MAG: hypothetical protein VKP62_03725 [Candidatus Sericytochromatia bacterium]|nr:hypothetical protein [Candidatus Sericytochromatia bacterium]